MKKLKLLFLWIVLPFVFSLSAQEIKVVDFETGIPVENVIVFDANKQILLHTNKKGIVNLRLFHLNDTIFFSHPEFETLRITKKEIIENRYRVEMYKPFTLLNTVVLTVSRNEKKQKDIARQVQVLDQMTIQKTIRSNTPEILENLPGISVQKSQGGGGSPVIRGLEANRVLLVIDGVRMNNAIYRTGHLHNSITIEPSILARMEVIYGPSAIYGSDAMGGIIHFISKTPVINNPKSFSGTVTGRFSTATEETSFHFSMETSRLNWASLTSLSYSDFGNIRMGSLRLHGYQDWGIVKEYSDNSSTYFNESPVTNTDLSIQPNTGYKQYGLFNKTIFELSPDVYLTFNTQFHSTSDIPRFDKLTETKNGHLKYAEWRYGPMQFFMFSPRVEFKPGRKWMNNVKIITSYQNVHESRIIRKFGDSIRKYKWEKLHIFTLNSDFSGSPGTNNKIYYGSEITFNKVISKAYGKKPEVADHQIIAENGDYYVASRYPNNGSYYMNFALYAQFEHKFNSKHQLSAGIRATQTFLKAAWKDLQLVELPFQKLQIKNFALTPTVHYIFSPRHWKFSLSLGSGFRSPNVDDVGKIREKKGKLLVPNIQLRPEYLYTAEIGIQNKLFNGIISFQSYLFYNIITNYIERQPYILNGFSQILYDGDLVDIYANVNGSNAYIYGTDIGLTFKPVRNLTWYNSYRYIKGKKKDGSPMPSIPPSKFLSKISYKNDFFEISGTFEYNARKPLNEYDVVSGIDNLDESPKDPVTGEYTGFPSWYRFDIAFNYYLTRHLTLSIGVDNLSDVHYKRFASAVSEPGRNLKIQITNRF